MNDTSASIKIRWTETQIVTYEAEVPVDQIPESIMWEGDDGEWGIETGDVDTHAGNEFFEALVNAGGPELEQSRGVENRYIEEDIEIIPPIMVAAPPLPAGPTSAEVAEYVRFLEEETFTPYNADEIIDVADVRRKDYES